MSSPEIEVAEGAGGVRSIGKATELYLCRCGASEHEP
jgi:CDGSH-type Zn-finger protein